VHLHYLVKLETRTNVFRFVSVRTQKITQPGGPTNTERSRCRTTNDDAVGSAHARNRRVAESCTGCRSVTAAAPRTNRFSATFDIFVVCGRRAGSFMKLPQCVCACVGRHHQLICSVCAELPPAFVWCVRLAFSKVRYPPSKSPLVLLRAQFESLQVESLFGLWIFEPIWCDTINKSCALERQLDMPHRTRKKINDGERKIKADQPRRSCPSF